MFWRRKKSTAVDQVYGVQNYAAQLGIERRRNTRILYPHQNLSCLPSIFYGSRSIKIHDISAGGVCLIDKEDHLGPHAGQDLELRLIWPDCERVVKCRMVSRVDVRRHIQFLDLEGDRAEAIKRAIVPGVAGQTMKPLVGETDPSVQLQAREVWNSTQGDTLTFTHDVHVLAEMTVNTKAYRFFRDSWPVDSENKPATSSEVERILIFLVNCPRPSAAIRDLHSLVQSLYFEGRSYEE